jgi:hypothetical protein
MRSSFNIMQAVFGVRASGEAGAAVHAPQMANVEMGEPRGANPQPQQQQHLTVSASGPAAVGSAGVGLPQQVPGAEPAAWVNRRSVEDEAPSGIGLGLGSGNGGVGASGSQHYAARMGTAGAVSGKDEEEEDGGCGGDGGSGDALGGYGGVHAGLGRLLPRALGVVSGAFKAPASMHVLCALHDFRLPMDLGSWRSSLVRVTVVTRTCMDEWRGWMGWGVQ